MDYKYSDITAKIIKAAMNVHNALGNGFQEKIYQRALEIELSLMVIDFKREVEIVVLHRDIQIGKRRVDFLVEIR